MSMKRDFHTLENIEVPELEIAFVVMCSAARKCPRLEMPAQ